MGQSPCFVASLDIIIESAFGFVSAIRDLMYKFPVRAKEM